MLDLEKNCTLHYFLCMCKVIYFIICYNLDGDIMTYLKVMFGVTSGADRTLNYKIDEVNVADNWNSNASDPKDMGGFNFSNDENILRWLIRGDTLYDVVIPEDAEVIKINHNSTPNGVFRSNKIILTNPRIVTDELAMELYKKSNMPEKTYYKALAGLAIRGYRNTCIELIRDRVNKDNVDLVLSEIDDFVKPYNSSGTSNNGNEVYEEIIRYLEEIKSDLLISRFIDKDIYTKLMTNDRVINITGESGSGKSYYSKRYLNDENYVIIDTDVVFGDRKPNNKYEEELQQKVHNSFSDYRSILCNEFDECYKFILDNIDIGEKRLVIDSAQYRNCKNLDILKGELIVVRTSIETCYKRCLSRYDEQNINATLEEKEKYANKKKAMFSWYLGINRFLKEIEKM